MLRSATILAMACVWASAALAQKTEMEMVRTMVQAEKKLLVARNLPLSEAEAERFWPVYNEYQEELGQVNDRLGKLIRDFAAEFETLSDDRALEMLEENQKINKKRFDLRQSWIKKFKKVLPGKKVARYYQIENKLQAQLDFELAKSVPLVQ